MTKEGNKKLLFMLTVWIVGLLAAKSGCQYIPFLERLMSSIPAIDAYKLAAAPRNACSAQAMWTYAWLVAPFICVWLLFLAYSEPADDRRDLRKRLIGVPVSLGLLAIGFYLIYFGLLKPYPGSGGMGTWESIYRSESVIGVVFVTAALWYGVYSIFLFSALVFTELFNIKR